MFNLLLECVLLCNVFENVPAFYLFYPLLNSFFLQFVFSLFCNMPLFFSYFFLENYRGRISGFNLFGLRPIDIENSKKAICKEYYSRKKCEKM